MMAITLFNASRDPIATKFAYIYAAISIGILVSSPLTSHVRAGLTIQPPSGLRISPLSTQDNYDSTKASRKLWYASSWCIKTWQSVTPVADETTGPLLIAATLFIAVLSNFIIRGMSCFVVCVGLDSQTYSHLHSTRIVCTHSIHCHLHAAN